MPENDRISVSRETLRAELAELELRLNATLVSRREVEDMTTIQGDHESRIRLLEMWRYALPASIGTAVASMVLSAIIAITKGLG